jgi:hypothetical protein
MEASDPVVMLISPIAIRTVAKATLRMRKMPHPSRKACDNVLTFLPLHERGNRLSGIEGRD